MYVNVCMHCVCVHATLVCMTLCVWYHESVHDLCGRGSYHTNTVFVYSTGTDMYMEFCKFTIETIPSLEFVMTELTEADHDHDVDPMYWALSLSPDQSVY